MSPHAFRNSWSHKVPDTFSHSPGGKIQHYFEQQTVYWGDVTAIVWKGADPQQKVSLLFEYSGTIDGLHVQVRGARRIKL